MRKALVNLEIDTAKLIYETVEHRHMTTLEWLNKARLLAVELKVGGEATPTSNATLSSVYNDTDYAVALPTHLQCKRREYMRTG